MPTENKGYTSQLPLQLRVATWLSSGQWNEMNETWKHPGSFLIKEQSSPFFLFFASCFLKWGGNGWSHSSPLGNEVTLGMGDMPCEPRCPIPLSPQESSTAYRRSLFVREKYNCTSFKLPHYSQPNLILIDIKLSNFFWKLERSFTPGPCRHSDAVSGSW